MYVGKFKHYLWTGGKGSYYAKDKSVFEGTWTGDMKQGEGVFNYDDSSNLKAIFDKDMIKNIIRY